jgi:thioredoxin-related protein
MKNKRVTQLCLSLCLVTASLLAQDELLLKSAIPNTNIKMQDVSGKQIALEDVKQPNGLLVIFSCNTCPYVKLSESRIKDMTALALKNKIGVVLVNSNEAQRNDEDSFEEMKKHAKEQDYKCYYVVDVNSKLADVFGATKTPHIFLFDKNGLAYKGAIDDNVRAPENVKDYFLRDAIEAVANGKAIKYSETKSIGCSIKRLNE